MQIRMQAVHSSDEYHYRKEVGGKPTREVRVRCNVLKLVKIDLKEHAFNSDIFLEVQCTEYT